MATRSCPIAVSWLFALACGACPGVTTPVEEPHMRAEESLALTLAIDDALSWLHLRLHAVNRDRIDMRALAIDWHLTIGEREPIHGRKPLDITVPAGAEATLDVNIRLPAELAVSIAESITAGQRACRVSGTVHYASPRGDVDGVFDDAGQLRFATSEPE